MLLGAEGKPFHIEKVDEVKMCEILFSELSTREILFSVLKALQGFLLVFCEHLLD